MPVNFEVTADNLKYFCIDKILLMTSHYKIARKSGVSSPTV
jgi:hypothetical protein